MRKKPIELYKNKEGYWDIYDDTYDITIHCTSQEEQEKVEKALINSISQEEIEKAYESILDVSEGGYVDMEEVKFWFCKWLGKEDKCVKIAKKRIVTVKKTCSRSI